MEMHPAHYEPIDMDTLKVFSQGFPNFSQPSNLELHSEGNEVVFGTFDVLVSDRLIASAPPFVHYVPKGRVVDKASTELHHCIAVITRAPTKTVAFCKIVEGTRFASPMLKIEHQSNSALTQNGWNCMFLFEKDFPEQTIQLTRNVTTTETHVGYTDSSIHKMKVNN